MNGTFLASILALGTSHSVYGQCPPEEPPLAPILETFDGYANGGIATLPNCWTMSPVSTSTSSQGWRIEDGTTVSSSTGPNVDNTLGTTAGKYIHLETSGGSTGALSSFETSDISLDNLGPNRQLSFYYHMYGATIGTLTVEVFDGTSYNSVFSLTGQQQTSGADPWQQANVSLASYSGVVRIRFSGTRGTSFTGDMAIDDVSIDNPPACSSVSNPITSNLTSSSVDVSWTAGDPSATQWQVEYGAPGFAAGSGTILPVTGSPTAALTGLAPNTTYSILIREACVASPGSFSPDVATIVTTLCAPVATWTENWDSYSGTGSSFSKWGCFERIGSATLAYLSTINNSSPYSFYISGSSTSGYPVVRMPEVTNGTAGTHRLELMARSSSSTTSAWFLVGYCSDPTDATTFVATDSAEFVGTTFLPYTLTPGAIPTGAQMAFSRRVAGTAMYIDDLAWVAIPTCEPVTAMSATGATSSSLDLSWTHAFGNAQDFNIEYGVAGFTPGSGMTSNGISGTTTTITGLTDNTAYDVYIQVNCGATDGLSAWNGPFSFVTPCIPSALPYTESFDTWPPACWDIDNGAAIPVHYGNDYMEGSFWGWNDISAYAYSQSVNIDVDARVKFRWSHLYNGVSYPNDQVVLLARIQGSASWDTIVNLIGPSFSSPGATNTAPSADADFVQEIHNLDPSYTGNVVEFRMDLNSDFGPDVFIDDFIVEAVPACPEPLGVTTSPVFGYQATISWNSSDSNFEIELDSAGFTPTGVATTTATDTFVVVTGLFPTTAYQYYIRTNCGGDYSPWQGPFSFTTTVSCPAPTFAGGTASPSGVTFSWTSNGLSMDYNYAVIHQDSSLKPSDILSTQALTATVTGLSDNTPYRIYLRDSCGAGDVSSWVTVNYTSPCNAQVAPYVQTFDAWPTNTQGLYDCWSIQAGQNVTGPPFWRSNIGATGSSGTGPATGNGGSGGYIFLETSVSNDDVAYSFSPFVDINSLNAPELTFYYHMYGATIGTLTVDVWNGASWVNVWDTTGQVQASDVAPWNKKSISLAAFSDTIQVRFGGTRNGSFTGDMAIDDVRIDEVPACNAPSNLASSYLTGDTAIFVWEAGDANATMWNVEYGPTGFSIGSGTSMTVTDTFAVLGGLTDRTTYDIYVSEKCVSNAGYSLTATTSFTTACPASIAAPYMEDFSAANISPFNSDFGNCWSTNAASTSVFRWEAEDATGINENSTGTGPFWDNTSFGVAGGVYMYVEASSGSAGSTTELYAPTVDISGLNNPAFTFYYHMYGATTGTLEVQVSDDGGATWTSAWSLSGQQQTAGGDSWIQAIVSLNGYGNLVDVKFIGTRGSSFDGDISIDDVAYEEGPACFPPSGLSASTTPTTATLSWNSTDVNATTWFVEYGAQGFAQGSGTSVTVTDTFASLTGLSSQTTYDYYVIEQCAGTTDSSAAASSSFTTGITVPYFEGFDAGYPPVGWTEAQGNIAEPTVLSGTTSGWDNDTWLNGSGNNAMKENLYSTGDDEWAFTPGIEIPAGMDVELSFDIAVLAWNSTTTPGVMQADDSVMVVISTDGTWNRSNAVYVLHAGNQFSGTDSSVAIDISAYAGNTIQIGFYDETTVSGSDLDIMFDNISVTRICPNYNPVAVTPGNYRVNLSWTSTGASVYNLWFRKVGDASFNKVNSSTTSRSLFPLEPGTYEYYLSEAGGQRAQCDTSTFTIVCEDFNFSSNVFQIVDATGGKVNVFGVDGGRRTWDFGISNGVDTTWATNRYSNRFINLDAGTYYFMVRDNYECYSSQIDTAVIDPLPSFVPTLTSVQNLGGGSLRPNWTVPDPSQVNAFQVRVKDMTGGGVGVLYATYTVGGGTSTNYTITGLPPARYRIDVRARPNNGTFADGVYSNYMERIVAATPAKGDAADASGDATAASIDVYPNPVANVLFVSAPAASEVTLMDLNGKVIAVRSINGQEVSFDMSPLANGVYMVRITNADQVTIQKVVKQ